MREHSVMRFKHPDQDHAAARFQPPSLSRRAPPFSSKYGMLTAVGKATSLTAEQARLWGNAVRFVFVVCGYAGLALGVHLGAASGF
jgi:hypothetical protein